MNTLITGISSGIGLATARFLAQRGVRVFGTMRSPNAYRELVQELKHTNGEQIEIIVMDVTSDESVLDGVNVVLDKANHIDSLICNAGIIVQGSIEETPIEVIKQQYDVNVLGTIRTIKAVLPKMRERRAGRIVLVSSVAALLAIPFAVNYSASKYATDAITEGLKQEVKPFGIQVSAVRPGDIQTKMRDNTVRCIPVDSPYRAWSRGACRVMDDAITQGPSPERVAKQIYRILRTPNPKTYYTAGSRIQTIVPFLTRLISSNIKEALVRMNYHVDRE